MAEETFDVLRKFAVENLFDDDAKHSDVMAGVALVSFCSLVASLMGQQMTFRKTFLVIRSMVMNANSSCVHKVARPFSRWDGLQVDFDANGFVRSVTGKEHSLTGDNLANVCYMKDHRYFAFIKGQSSTVCFPKFFFRNGAERMFCHTNKGVISLLLAPALIERHEVLCGAILYLISRRPRVGKLNNDKLQSIVDLLVAVYNFLNDKSCEACEDKLLDYVFRDVLSLFDGEMVYDAEQLGQNVPDLSVPPVFDSESRVPSYAVRLRQALDFFVVADLPITTLCTYGSTVEDKTRLANLFAKSSLRLPRSVLPGEMNNKNLEQKNMAVKSLDKCDAEDLVFCEKQKSTYSALLKFFKRDSDFKVYVFVPSDKPKPSKGRSSKKRKVGSVEEGGEAEVVPQQPEGDVLAAKYYLMLSPTPVKVDLPVVATPLLLDKPKGAAKPSLEF